MIMEEDPVDDGSERNKHNFLSISPMIRETLEIRRAKEIREGNRATVNLLNPS